MSTPPFLDLPPTARAYQAVTSRGRFAVLDVPAAAKPARATALLVPGFTGSKEDFVAVLAPLAAAGHRVVAVDQAGQYETAGPDDPAAYAVDALAADLHALIDAVGDGPVHLLGHSFGGLVARAATVARPATVRSLTLLASGPAALSGRPAERAELLLSALNHYDLPTLWQAIQVFDAQAENPLPAPAGITEFLRRRFVSNSPTALRAMGRELVSEPDRIAELAACGVPVLVAYGPDDDVWPPDLQSEMAQRLGARRAVIDGGAHSPAAEQPERTAAALVGFWSEVEAGRAQPGPTRAPASPQTPMGVPERNAR